MRLVSVREIDIAAALTQRRLSGASPKYLMVPDVNVGDVGTARKMEDGGMFEVRFPHCTILCNEAMVEAAND